ncbi:MAG: tetratricopeptide repeat-containing diguanylate cyclase, partial [Marinicella sp.]
VYGALDLPNEMLNQSEFGLEIVDKAAEPWLWHFLNLFRIDALHRNGLAFSEIDSIRKTITWAKQHNHNTLAASGLLLLSSLYIGVEDYSKALSYIQEALELAPLEDEIINHADVNRELAAIYIHRNEFELALPYFTASYEHNKNMSNILGMSIDLFEMGRAHLELNNFELGIKELNKSIELSQSIDDQQGVAYAKTELANHFYHQGEYSKAEKLLLESSQQFKSGGNSMMLFDTLILLSMTYSENKQLDLAEKFLQDAAELNVIGQIRYGNITINRQKARILAEQMKHQEAYELLLNAELEQEDLESKLSIDKLNELRVQFEIKANAIENQLLTEKNNNQAAIIANQAQKSALLVVLVLLLALIVVLSFFLNRNLRKHSLKLHKLANYDELTGLMNRSHVFKTIRNKLSQMDPEDDIAVVMIDLDHFKVINDTFGHALGDKVLSIFGEYCQNISQQTELIGRLGGEEFMIAFIDLAGEHDLIYDVIDKLRLTTKSMSESLSAPGLKISISAGICHGKGKYKFRDLLKHADTAMYQAKHNGRNQICTITLD